MSIINPKYRHIFVHIPRTAGSSMEVLPYIGGRGHRTLMEFIEWGCDDYSNKYNSNFLKWSFVRNPFDRLVSAFHWMKAERINKRVQQFKTFKEFVHHLQEPQVISERQIWPQVHYITVDDKIGLDFMGRFENLRVDFNKLCDMLKIPNVMNHLAKTGHAPWPRYYDKPMMDIVRKVYAKDFAILGYNPSGK